MKRNILFLVCIATLLFNCTTEETTLNEIDSIETELNRVPVASNFSLFPFININYDSNLSVDEIDIVRERYVASSFLDLNAPSFSENMIFENLNEDPDVNLVSGDADITQILPLSQGYMIFMYDNNLLDSHSETWIIRWMPIKPGAGTLGGF